MAKTHTVRQGECLSSIAKQHGFLDWRQIYDHSGNADFRKKRPNPNLIHPGDKLVIPDKKIKTASCATGQVHRFTLTKSRTLVRIRVEDEKQEALANKPYRLKFGNTILEGKTNADGLVEQPVEEQVLTGELSIWLDDDRADDPLCWELQIGHLDPAEEVSGLQARLNNLGFDCNDVSGNMDDKTRAALALFQNANHLVASGELDEATQIMLCQLHDGS